MEKTLAPLLPPTRLPAHRDRGAEHFADDQGAADVAPAAEQAGQPFLCHRGRHFGRQRPSLAVTIAVAVALARLWGGFRLLLLAAALYLPAVYAVGLLLGAAMGYFGGLFDLIFQVVFTRK